MLKYWGLLSLLLPLTLLAQKLPMDPGSGKIYLAEEILVKDGPQADLYSRAKEWFANSTKNNRTLKTDDFANGLLIGSNKAFITVENGNKSKSYILCYIVKIEMEDDRYWYSLSEFFLLQEFNASNPNSVKKIPVKQPLENMLFFKKAEPGNQKAYSQSLERAVVKSITDSVQELKLKML